MAYTFAIVRLATAVKIKIPFLNLTVGGPESWSSAWMLSPPYLLRQDNPMSGATNAMRFIGSPGGHPLFPIIALGSMLRNGSRVAARSRRPADCYDRESGFG